MSILHFQEAVLQHHKWLEELRSCLLGDGCDLRAEEILRDDHCVIGRWLHGDGMAFAHLSEYQIVKDLHKQVHEIAMQAWHAKTDEAHDQIEDLLMQLDKIKHAMFMSWNQLNDIIGDLE